ncbi:MAG: GNAT family N-acetyltransferase [Deltaproteobacteria bacterium]|nr:GNAT family N-acetyltransferase [Deltaproteobacteria bacterium]
MPLAEELSLLDEIEASAWRDLVAAAPPDLVAMTGMACRQRGAVTALTAPRMPVPLYNRALGLGNRAPATEAELDLVLGHFDEAGVRDPWIQVAPTAQPGALVGWLAARGLVPARRSAWGKFVRGREPAPVVATDLAIREVDDADADRLVAVLLAAHGMPGLLGGQLRALVGRPGWRMYGAFDGDALVGGAAMRIDGTTAWLGLGGTAPSHRRRGGQGALMARRIADAIAAGVEVIATETGEPIAGEHNPSRANMLRAGFRLAGARFNFVRG